MDNNLGELLDNKYVKEIKSKWHIISVAVISIFMFLIRIRSRENFITEEKIYFSGNDAWYHFHQTMYTVKNWPNTNFYDPWTGYPEGAKVGHFGTLLDQIMATVSIIIGLGDPSVETVRTVMIYFPPVLGALTAIVVYLIGSKMANKKVGVLSAFLLAFIPGTFLRRTSVGFADHHAAEVLFMSIAFLIGVYAFKVASEEKFIVEDFKQRGDSFKKLVKVSSLLSLGFLAYMLVWPPGVMMVGVAGIFYVVYSISRVMMSKTHESVLLVGGISNILLTALLLPFARIFTSTSTIIGLLHIMITLSVGIGCFFLIFLQRKLESIEYEETYPVAVVGSAIISIGLLWIVAPNIFESIRIGIVGNFGLSVSDDLRTIGEAQSMISRGGVVRQMFSNYGGLMFFGLIYFIILPVKNRFEDSTFIKLKAHYVYLSVWFFMMSMAAMTQVRYNYYLAAVIAITSAIASYSLISILYSRKTKDSKGWYYITLIIIVTLLIAPTAPVIGFTSVYDQSGNYGPGGYLKWEDSLEWVDENTPETSLQKYQPYGEDYEYGKNDYGIMSWWDYGHWITVTANRIPYANPFQQHAQEAADFLLSQSEEKSEEVVRNMGDQKERRYVMIDWQMVSPTSKFRAPTVWSKNHNPGEFTDRIYTPVRRGRLAPVGIYKKQKYYNTTMARLYYYHGSYKGVDPVVVSYNTQPSGQGNIKTISRGQGIYQRADNMTEARQIVEQTGGSIGGIGIHPIEDVPAMEHYRYIYGSKTSVESSRDFASTVRRGTAQNNLKISDFVVSRSFVKVFERVPGAKIKGTGAPPNSTISATVSLEEPNHGDRFRYRQNTQVDSNGNFSMTVPYSTTGYEKWGPEDGYSNISVKAVSQYNIISTDTEVRNGTEVTVIDESKTIEVPEAKVIGEDDSPIRINFGSTAQGNQSNNSTQTGE